MIQRISNRDCTNSLSVIVASTLVIQRTTQPRQVNVSAAVTMPINRMADHLKTNRTLKIRAKSTHPNNLSASFIVMVLLS
jgi:hypothetical protein